MSPGDNATPNTDLAKALAETMSPQEWRRLHDELIGELPLDELLVDDLTRVKEGLEWALGREIGYHLWNKFREERLRPKPSQRQLTLRLPDEFSVQVQNKWSTLRGELLTELGVELPEARLEKGKTWQVYLEGQKLTEGDPGPNWYPALKRALRRHAPLFLRFEDTVRLVERLAVVAPALHHEIGVRKVCLGTIHRVLELLLEEGVAISPNFEELVLAIVLESTWTPHPLALAQSVRDRLGQRLCGPHLKNGRLELIVPAEEVHERLGSLPELGSYYFQSLDSSRYDEILFGALHRISDRGRGFVICTFRRYRFLLSRLLRRHCPEVTILAFSEIPPGQPVCNVGEIKLESRRPRTALRGGYSSSIVRCSTRLGRTGVSGGPMIREPGAAFGMRR